MCLLHMHVPAEQLPPLQDLRLQRLDLRLQLLDLAAQSIGRRCCCVGAGPLIQLHPSLSVSCPSLSVSCPGTTTRGNLGTTSCDLGTSCKASTAANCSSSACCRMLHGYQLARFSSPRTICIARTTCHPATGEFCPPRRSRSRSPLEAPDPPFRRADEREVQRGRM